MDVPEGLGRPRRLRDPVPEVGRGAAQVRLVDPGRRPRPLRLEAPRVRHRRHPLRHPRSAPLGPADPRPGGGVRDPADLAPARAGTPAQRLTGHRRHVPRAAHRVPGARHGHEPRVRVGDRTRAGRTQTGVRGPGGLGRPRQRRGTRTTAASPGHTFASQPGIAKDAPGPIATNADGSVLLWSFVHWDGTRYPPTARRTTARPGPRSPPSRRAPRRSRTRWTRCSSTRTTPTRGRCSPAPTAAAPSPPAPPVCPPETPSSSWSRRPAAAATCG